MPGRRRGGRQRAAGPLAAHGEALSRRSYALLAATSLAAGLAPAALEGLDSPALGLLAAASTWVVFLGQLAYVATATPWLLRHLLARR